jgi:hypothetical protein
VTEAPSLIVFRGEWARYEDEVYEAFLDSFVRPDVRFRGSRVSAPFRPPSKGKHFSFWHVVSEAPGPKDRDESNRVPDLRRCERIRWIAWTIEECDRDAPGFSWWRNRRGRDKRVVLWAEEHDYAVILAERSGYFILKTAYFGIKPHQRRSFERERDASRRPEKG